MRPRANIFWTSVFKRLAKSFVLRYQIGSRPTLAIPLPHLSLYASEQLSTVPSSGEGFAAGTRTNATIPRRNHLRQYLAASGAREQDPANKKHFGRVPVVARDSIRGLKKLVAFLGLRLDYGLLAYFARSSPLKNLWPPSEPSSAPSRSS